MKREALAATHLARGDYDEAEQVYRADLRQHPRNGRALHGLAAALRGQHRMHEAGLVEQRADMAWDTADTPLADPAPRAERSEAAADSARLGLTGQATGGPRRTRRRAAVRGMGQLEHLKPARRAGSATHVRQGSGWLDCGARHPQ